jgi:hypothetical protein
MKLLNTELPKLFEVNGVPEVIVGNIHRRLEMIGDQIAKEKGSELFMLSPEWVAYIDGFIEGTCLMLYAGRFIDQEQYKNIVNDWTAYCESMDVN